MSDNISDNMDWKEKRARDEEKMLYGSTISNPLSPSTVTYESKIRATLSWNSFAPH